MLSSILRLKRQCRQDEWALSLELEELGTLQMAPELCLERGQKKEWSCHFCFVLFLRFTNPWCQADGSAGKALAMQACRPEFGPPGPIVRYHVNYV